MSKVVPQNLATSLGGESGESPENVDINYIRQLLENISAPISSENENEIGDEFQQSDVNDAAAHLPAPQDEPAYLPGIIHSRKKCCHTSALQNRRKSP